MEEEPISQAAPSRSGTASAEVITAGRLCEALPDSVAEGVKNNVLACGEDGVGDDDEGPEAVRAKNIPRQAPGKNRLDGGFEDYGQLGECAVAVGATGREFVEGHAEDDHREWDGDLRDELQEVEHQVRDLDSDGADEDPGKHPVLRRHGRQHERGADDSGHLGRRRATKAGPPS